MFETSHYRELTRWRNRGLMMWYGALVWGNKGIIFTFHYTGRKTAIYCRTSAAASLFGLFYRHLERNKSLSATALISEHNCFHIVAALCAKLQVERRNKSVRSDIYMKSLVTLMFTGKVPAFMYARREPSVCKGSKRAQCVWNGDYGFCSSESLNFKLCSTQWGEWGLSTVCICSYV